MMEIARKYNPTNIQTFCFSSYSSTGCVKILFQRGNTIISNSMTTEFYTKLKLMKNGIYECD
jgi:hypothetical protein